MCQLPTGTKSGGGKPDGIQPDGRQPLFPFFSLETGRDTTFDPEVRIPLCTAESSQSLLPASGDPLQSRFKGQSEG